MATLDGLVGEWNGTCGFRMMPTDELADAGSTAQVHKNGEATVVDYTWEHPDDGPQYGTIRVTESPSGELAGVWTDSWHQKDEAALTGQVRDATAHLSMTYEQEWGWRVSLEPVGEGGALMLMHNVIPESHARDDIAAGPYVVMNAQWRRSADRPS